MGYEIQTPQAKTDAVEDSKPEIHWGFNFLPDVKVKDRTATVTTALEYEVLVDKVEKKQQILCTLFYSGSSVSDQAIKSDLKELAKSNKSSTTYCFVDTDKASAFAQAAAISKEKLPVLVFDGKATADQRHYIHFYPRLTSTARVEEMLKSYESGEKKLELKP